MSCLLPSSRAVVFRAIAESRRSCKRFQPGRLIPGEILEDVLRTSLRTPSGFNLQPTQIVVVEDQPLKERIAALAMLGAGNQYRTRDCSALAVFLSDLEVSKRVPRILRLERDWGRRHPNYTALLPLTSRFLLGEGHAATWAKQLATGLLSGGGGNPFQSSPPSAASAMPTIDPVLAWSYKNTGLMVQSFVLACTSHDLATCVMEGVDTRQLSRILRVPDRYAIPMVVAAGFYHHREISTTTEEEQHHPTPRLPLEEVVFRESFGVQWSREADGKDPDCDDEEDDDEQRDGVLPEASGS